MKRRKSGLQGLVGLGRQYAQKGKLLWLVVLFVCLANHVLAQNRTISGQVFTNDGNPVPGCTVTLKGTTVRSITDKKGNYQINVPGKGGALEFTRWGLVSTEIEIGDKNTINLTTSETVTEEPPGESFVATESWRALRRAELTDPKTLFSRGESKLYRDSYLEEIRLPVGGVGTGAIQMDGYGRRFSWQLWRNFADFPLPNSIFAVRATKAAGEPVVRVLQTVKEGPFQAMKSLAFKGQFPFGEYFFEDADLPVQVSMEVFNPFIPLDPKNSAIPCAIYNLKVRNTSDRPVDVSFLATQQNASGLVQPLPKLPYDTLKKRILGRAPDHWRVEGRKSDQYGGNRNVVIRDKSQTLIYMTGKHASNAPAHGEMVLAVRDPGAVASASWSNYQSLYDEFKSTGKVSGPNKSGPSPNGETVDGALATPFVVQPGEERTVSFILFWYFPNIPMIVDENCPLWKHDGYVYKNWWPNGLELAKDVLKRFDDLSAVTRKYHDSFYGSNLPYWFLDRINSQTAILRSATAFWANDDHFGVWEGVSWAYGSCAGNATHVWGYAQAVPRLFPSIGRKMREQEHNEQTPEGMLPVRLGMPKPFQAYDGQCHSILASYLGHLQSTDGAWLKRQWPKIKESMDYLIKGWDEDEDGMLSGAQHGMDSKHGGTSSWMGSMYMGALAASEKMATLQGDTKSASRYGKILREGSKKQDEMLFNGEYYIQIPDIKPNRDYLTGCYSDQLLGQWWLNLLDLGWVYPRDHVRSAMNALYKYNFKTDFSTFEQIPRKFAADYDAGLVQTTWPRGGRPAPENLILFADEVKDGISYPVAALMLQAGMTTEAFAIVRSNYERYDGRLRTGLTDNAFSGLGISGNPFGDDGAGKFYVRALGVWSLLVAAQGQILDGPNGLIGFIPTWLPNDHLSFFTSSNGWGKFSQKRSDRNQTDKIELDWGQLKLRQLVFALPEGVKPGKVEVRSKGNAVNATHKSVGDRVYISLTTEMLMKSGDSIEVSIDYQ
jgi:non-lysosomal glucosylceramidase